MLSRYVPRAPSGAVALVILAAYFGLAAILARYLATGIGLFEQWYLRFGTGFVIALVVFRRRIDLGKFRRLPRREWLVLVARVGSGSVAAVAFYTLAVQHAKIGQVVLLQAFPILAILSVVLTRERLTPAKGLLVLISFFGVALVAVPDPTDLADLSVGGVYSLASAGFFAFAYITRTWHGTSLNNCEITVAMLGLGFLVNLALSIALYHRAFIAPARLATPFVLVVLCAGALEVGSVFLQNYGFARVSGVTAETILNLEQVFGSVLGFVFYRETLTGRELLGGVFIVGAASTMSRLGTP